MDIESITITIGTYVWHFEGWAAIGVAALISVPLWCLAYWVAFR